MGRFHIFSLQSRRRAARTAGLSAFVLSLSPGAGLGSVFDTPRFQVTGMVIVWAADANGVAPIVSDLIIDSGSGATAVTSGDVDLISTDVHTVVTGELTAVIDANAERGEPIRIQRSDRGGFNVGRGNNGILDGADQFDAFGFNGAGTTDINTIRSEIFSSFFVASNVAFAIDASATPLGTTSARDFDRMRLQLRVTLTGDDGIAFGSAAQFPHSAGTAGGSRANNRRLNALAAQPNVFQGNQPTARVPGTLAEQSVRFDARYRFRSETYDLSDGEIDAAAEVIYTVYVP